MKHRCELRFRSHWIFTHASLFALAWLFLYILYALLLDRISVRDGQSDGRTGKTRNAACSSNVDGAV